MRLPLLLAYALMLAGSPVGEAGLLGAHLTSAHTAQPVAAIVVPWRDEARRAPTGAPHEHDLVDEPAPHEHEPAAGHSHAHEPAAEHPHPSATHEHRHASAAQHAQAPVATADEPRAVAPGEPHRHGGTVHDHQSHPAGDVAQAVGALSKYYLRPSTSAALPIPVDARFARLTVPTPRPVAARVDTPPPQVPG